MMAHDQSKMNRRMMLVCLTSASPAATESIRPPRAMTFEGCEIGRIVGRAGDRPFHHRVVRAALETFAHDTPPGKVVTKIIR